MSLFKMYSAGLIVSISFFFFNNWQVYYTKDGKRAFIIKTWFGFLVIISSAISPVIIFVNSKLRSINAKYLSLTHESLI
jgi:hypothetical protein